MLECLIHEPLAREIGQPLLTLSSLNKINLILIFFNRNIRASFHQECSILISRALVTYYKPFKIFRDVVINHIPHPYMEESAKKSNIVSFKTYLLYQIKR